MEKKRIIPVLLSKGKRIYVEITPIGSSAEDISSKSYNFENIEVILNDLTKKISKAIESSKPQKASVEFGLEITAESGDLTAILVKGSVNANIKIKLEWEQK
jgi:hypothetical protein